MWPARKRYKTQKRIEEPKIEKGLFEKGLSREGPFLRVRKMTDPTAVVTDGVCNGNKNGTAFYNGTDRYRFVSILSATIRAEA